MYKHIQTRKYDIIVMIKKILLGILLMYPAFTISAQTLKDAFVNMPDSLLPSLSHNNRLDMIDFINSGMKAEVTNLFDGKSSMSMLNDRYLKIQLNDYVSVEMMLFTDSTASVKDSSSTLNSLHLRRFCRPEATENALYLSYISRPRPRLIVQPSSVVICQS